MIGWTSGSIATIFHRPLLWLFVRIVELTLAAADATVTSPGRER
jgi:hypothetical protein